MERTLGIIKPDAVQHATKILARIRKAGFDIVAKRKRHLKEADAGEFYAEHTGKSFFDDLVKYMTEGSSIFLVLSKRRAISSWRTLIGPTNTEKAKEEQPNSLRALYGSSPHKNGLHGSDSYVSAEREIKLMFPRLETKPLPDQIRNYLAVEVNHVLATALADLCTVKPDDPLLWLAQWLHTHAKDQTESSQGASSTTNASSQPNKHKKATVTGKRKKASTKKTESTEA